MLMKARALVQKEIDEQWWASIFRFARRQVEASLKTTLKNHRKKLEKLAKRQDNSLGRRNDVLPARCTPKNPVYSALDNTTLILILSAASIVQYSPCTCWFLIPTASYTPPL